MSYLVTVVICISSRLNITHMGEEIKELWVGICSSDIPVVYLRTKYTNTCRKDKNTIIIVIYKVLMYVYANVSANYMFRPLLVRPS